MSIDRVVPPVSWKLLPPKHSPLSSKQENSCVQAALNHFKMAHWSPWSRWIFLTPPQVLWTGQQWRMPSPRQILKKMSRKTLKVSLPKIWQEVSWQWIFLSDCSQTIIRPEPGACGFYVQRKKRFCRMIVKPGAQYCGEHQPLPVTEQELGIPDQGSLFPE